MTTRKLLVVASISTLISTAFVVLVVAEEKTPSNSNGQASPVLGVTLPPGYREWQFISVAHEAGEVVAPIRTAG